MYVEIDGYTLELHKLRHRPTPDQQKEVEATEGKIMPLLQVQDAKKRYRTTFEQLQEKKAEVSYLGKIKAKMLQQVALQFQVWKDQHERDLETVVAVGWPG
ncbi:hypothetical protein GN244_ATG09755 [Phytophthora infestans]|uniref:Uncharacterized protein n=1 Tax=Phytophthora infestans TaxID=4787 RepID=A0A833T6B7_PHYIN|nr:hypothetical protein GN244_ATG09755 [Phytophthora infestans]